MISHNLLIAGSLIKSCMNFYKKFMHDTPLGSAANILSTCLCQASVPVDRFCAWQRSRKASEAEPSVTSN